MLTQEENQLLTLTGPATEMGTLLRRFWMPALLADELPEPDCPPVRVTVMGEQLVAFKDTDGRIGFLDKRCPHRLASLFWGRNEEGGLRCAYHGWKFDVVGACVDIPNAPEGVSYKDKIGAFAAYPGAEHGGIIWIYMGPPELRAELPELEFTRVPESHRFIRKIVVNCNYLQAMEGDIDSSHVSFLHRIEYFGPGADTLTGVANPTMFKDTSPSWHVHDTEYGVMLAARRDAGDEGYHWRVNQWLMPGITIIANRTGNTLQINMRTPIDETHVMLFRLWWHPERPLTDVEVDDLSNAGIMMAELIPGTFDPSENMDNDYLIDRVKQSSGKSYTGIKSVPAQDMAMQEDQAGPLTDRSIEHLVSSDTAIIQVRRRLLSSVLALREGQEPPEAHSPDLYRVRSLDMVLPKDQDIETQGREHMVARA